MTSAPTQPSAVNCATATCARRLPAAGQLERFSRTSARNPPPTDGRRDSLAPWPRKRPKLEAHPPAARGPDCPKYRNRFLQKRRVSVLPRARHGRKPGVATDGERQQRLQVRAQKGHSISLVRVATQAQPEQMNVIGHQSIGGTEKSFARRHMQ